MKKILLSIIFSAFIIFNTAFIKPVFAENESSVSETIISSEEYTEENEGVLNPVVVFILLGLCTAGIVVIIKFSKNKF